MDVSFAIRHRLEELGLEQKDLARAGRVTESYVSQLLARKKLPPDPRRTDIYERMDRFLKLPDGELARLARGQRKSQLKRDLEDGPSPLFGSVRALVLEKGNPAKATEIRSIVEQHPFGELERLVTQKLLDVVKQETQVGLADDAWLRRIAKSMRRSVEETRARARRLLAADVFDLANDTCIALIDAVVVSWDIDLVSFGITIGLDSRLTGQAIRRFEMVERGTESIDQQPGFREFLANPVFSATATKDELEYLRSLPWVRRPPTALYYYRQLQTLRDPAHFRSA